MGSASRVPPLQEIAPQRIVLAAPGSSQRAVVAALAAAGWPVAVVHPRPARDVAKATGPLAQTEARDARRARLARRRPVVPRRTAEQHRLGSALPRRPPDIQAHIAGLNTRLTTLDDDLDTTRRARPVWRAWDEWLRRVSGLGPVCARPRLLDWPELGPWSRHRLAALVGVAPLNRDRGTLRGRRTTWGGRAHVRATRSRSTLVAVRSHPVRKAFYARLRATGKAAQVALTACMRTLLTILKAMVKPQTPGQPREVPSA